MGAGAGYTIKFDIGAVGGYGDTAKQITSIEYRDGMLAIDGRIECFGKVAGESYYHGSGWIDNVDVVATHIEMDVSWAWDLLTSECVNRIETQFDSDINAIDFDDYKATLTSEDFDFGEVAAKVSDYLTLNEESKVLGWGWSHSTFTGVAEVETYDLYSVELEITDEAVVDYLDRAITGDNTMYEVFIEGGGEESFEDQQDAIDFLKGYLDAAIESGDIYDMDLSSCYVDEYRDILVSANPMEWDMDSDNLYTVYDASDDPDYQEYL